MNGYNDDITNDQLAKLRQLFPEVFTEDNIDWARLKATLGEAVDLGERYGLGWKGKSGVFAKIQEKTVETLHADRAHSVDWDTTSNMFIEGDNLAALKILHKAYYGKVKMIYIDPPYNTGNDFIYNDDFKQTRRSYEAEAGITDDEGNVVRDDGLRTNTGGHKHSNWLNMMYPRLFLARNLLRQDGVIFVSIDDNEVHNLRLMMNEIFGEENFVADFVWKRGGGRQDSKYVAVITEHILCFGRKVEQLDMREMEKEGEVFSKFDEVKQKKYKTQLLRKWGSNSRREDRPNLFYAIKAPDGSDVFPKNGAGDGRWRWALARMLDEMKKGNVEFVHDEKTGEWIPYEKIYEGERSTKKFTTIIDSVSSSKGTKDLKSLMGGDYFDYPKPTDLIKLFAQMMDDDEGIVLDFFSGSGTTAHAVAELNAEDGGNRRWICVQLPELTDDKSEAYRAGYRTIADITRERIRRAGAKIRADQANKLASRDTPLDLGFRAYRVDDSNFKQWNELVSDPEEIRQQALESIDPLEPNATDDDILTEVLLKRGISPLVTIEQRNNYLLIPSESLAISLAANLTETDFACLLDSGAEQIVLLSRAFGDDVNLKANAMLQAEQRGVRVEVA